MSSKKRHSPEPAKPAQTQESHENTDAIMKKTKITDHLKKKTGNEPKKIDDNSKKTTEDKSKGDSQQIPYNLRSSKKGQAPKDNDNEIIQEEPPRKPRTPKKKSPKSNDQKQTDVSLDNSQRRAPGECSNVNKGNQGHMSIEEDAKEDPSKMEVEPGDLNFRVVDQRAQDGEPQAQGGKPQAQDGEPQAQGGKPQAQGGEPQAQGGKPQAQDGEPQAQGGKPQAQGGEPQAQGGKLQAQNQEPHSQKDALNISINNNEEAMNNVQQAGEAMNNVQQAGEAMNNVQQAEEILKMIREERIQDIYQNDFSKNPLAQKLFRTGIDPKELTANAIQERFIPKRADGQYTPNIVFYPTSKTSDIFRKIFSINQSKSFISSITGIGKSFGLALLVYLLRQNAQNRVLYIHDPSAFTLNPTTYLVKELRSTFPQEIAEINLNAELQGLLQPSGDINLLTAQITRYISDLFEKVHQKNLQLYILMDQVNALRNIKNDDDPQKKLAWRIYERLRHPNLPDRFTVAMMLSATDEMITKEVNQNFNYLSLDWKGSDEEPVKRFIYDIFSLDPNKNEDKLFYETIKNFSNGHFLTISEFAAYYSEHKGEVTLTDCLENFTDLKTPRLLTDIDKFLRADDADPSDKENLRKNRRGATAKILWSILNDTTCSMTLPKNYDGRHFRMVSLGGSSKAEPINSLIMRAYQDTFTDLTLVRSMIQTFARDAPVLGFILENLVLVVYPKSSIAGNLQVEPLKASQEKTFIDFTEPEKRFVLSPDNFELDKKGLYIPSIFNFALYDGFLVDEQNIWAIQITKFADKKKIEDLASENWKKDPQSLRFNTKKYVQGKLDELKDKGEKTVKTLLISLGQKPQTDKSFESLRNSGARAQNFFYMDATSMLAKLGLETNYIEVLKRGGVQEYSEESI